MIRSNYFIILSTLLLIFISTASISLFFTTQSNIKSVPKSLTSYLKEEAKKEPPLLTDRYGTPLNTTYLTKWNYIDNVSLHKIPDIVQTIFILSEDKNFYTHNGIDWFARIHALFQNIFAGKTLRGASTITEQVVRMVNPRKRTLLSKWLEGVEAIELEKSNSKSDILEFYLNQVPYASNRRGIVQAARLYFDRTLETLSIREILALATLIRAPSAYNLHLHQKDDKQTSQDRFYKSLNSLAKRAVSKGAITQSQWDQVKDTPFELTKHELLIEAPHFVRYVYDTILPSTSFNQPNNDVAGYSYDNTQIKTTLNGALQNKSHKILTTALKNYNDHKATNGALLIVEHSTGQILAWVTSGQPETKFIDSVRALRQPGSAMKPFLYALALENGWSAATIIDDYPLNEPVGLGVHTYHNYSNIHYGAVTLRDALGNSLNIPAVKAIRFTGVEKYLAKLKQLGITTLNQHPNFYGDGLALGNGEVTLYDMVQAYSVLANSGKFIPLNSIYNESGRLSTPNILNKEIFSKEVSSIIGDILSDSGARELEFGGSDLLNFPIQTAVKTGTSSDYRDAWAMGYNSRYTAGVWIGNLDGSPTIGMTGSKAPALVLRGIFAELNRISEQKNIGCGDRPLYMSPSLVKKDIYTIKSNGKFVKKSEWFVPQKSAQNFVTMDNNDYNFKANSRKFEFLSPFNGIEVAMDPRIPDEFEYMEFSLSGLAPNDRVNWFVDDELLAKNSMGDGFIQWKIERGEHKVYAELIDESGKLVAQDSVSFFVK
ncbi:MAG: transglycosylase domain-containing protein [Desulfamplus sp.]|nr:transglycosylase domain-containing protein [Desulfamplus sp.]